MFNKKLLSIVFITLLGLLLAACGGAQPTAAPAAEEPAATEEAAADAPAAEEAAAESADCAETKTIEFWHIHTQDERKVVLQKSIDAFEADHPCVKINSTILENENFKAKLTTVMQSGEPPDVFSTWGGGVMDEYAKAGLLRDISAEIQKDGFADTFAPGPLAVYGYQGEQYGVANDQGMVGFWYNTDLFDQAGIDAPPTTWAELLEDVQKLKDAGITPIALGEGDKWPGHFWWVYLAIRMGGEEAFNAAASGEGSFADEPFVQAGEKLQELIALDPFPAGYLGLTYNDQARLMGNGEAAMELMGQWAPGVEKDESTSKEGIGDKLGWFPFPMVEGGKGDPADALGGGGGYIVGRDAPDEAIEFLKYLSTKEIQCETTWVLPVVKGTEECITDPLMKIVAENAAKAPYMQLYYDQALPPAVGSVVNDSVQGLFAGTSSPEEVGQAIQESFDLEMGQ
ncbi:MAG: extracellular solute-binding protein [Anaerolineales bacterium]|nr:extracellular solute-binding protein [Anaerolineales bacterium]